MAPARTSKVESNDEMVWYFLTRTLDRWVTEEDRREIWDLEKDKLGKELSRHILEGKEPAELKCPN